MFTNSALGEVQKQIFTINRDVSRNVLVQADNTFNELKKNIFQEPF